METPKKFLYFLKENCSYVLGKGHSKIASYISGGNMQSLKMKIFLYFSS